MGNKIVIGGSDFSKEEIFSGRIYTWGGDYEEWKNTIEYYERKGYTVVFETSILRKLFGANKYKVVAIKK